MRILTTVTDTKLGGTGLYQAPSFDDIAQKDANTLFYKSFEPAAQ
jgi:hypothetical protein